MRIGLVIWMIVAILCPSHSLRAETKPFKLGFISILTGSYSDVGQAMAKAAELATEDYQRDHPERKITFILEDDAHDPKKAMSAYLKLSDADKADLIMPISTFAIGALRDRLNREKKLTFILGNEPYDPQDDYIYMVSPAAAPAEQGLGAAIRNDFKSGKVLILASQNEALTRFAKAVKEGVGAEAEILEVPSGADYRALALRIKAMKPVAIAFNAFPLDSANIVKELRRINFIPALYFDENIANSNTEFRTVLQDLSPLRDAKILRLGTNIQPDFSERFRKRFGTPATIWTDFAYDATYLALTLKDKPVEEARAWLASNTYHGVSGDIRFDNTGLRIAEFSVVPLKEYPSYKDKLG